MNSTDPKIIRLVVRALAVLTGMGMTSICLGMFIHVYADQSIITAVLTMTGTFGGALTGLLINTRSQQASPEGTSLPPPPEKV